MSRKPENTFISSIHRHLPVDIYSMKNNNEYNAGIADCWYSGKAGDLWVEYKFLEVPKRPSTVLNFCDIKKPYSLTTLQQEWLNRRFLEGRAVGVVVGCSGGGVWLPGCSFNLAMTAQEFTNALKSRRELAELIAQKTHG